MLQLFPTLHHNNDNDNDNNNNNDNKHDNNNTLNNTDNNTSNNEPPTPFEASGASGLLARSVSIISVFEISI